MSSFSEILVLVGCRPELLTLHHVSISVSASRASRKIGICSTSLHDKLVHYVRGGPSSCPAIAGSRATQEGPLLGAMCQGAWFWAATRRSCRRRRRRQQSERRSSKRNARTPARVGKAVPSLCSCRSWIESGCDKKSRLIGRRHVRANYGCGMIWLAAGCGQACSRYSWNSCGRTALAASGIGARLHRCGLADLDEELRQQQAAQEAWSRDCTATAFASKRDSPRKMGPRRQKLHRDGRS